MAKRREDPEKELLKAIRSMLTATLKNDLGKMQGWQKWILCNYPDPTIEFVLGKLFKGKI